MTRTLPAFVYDRVAMTSLDLDHIRALNRRKVLQCIRDSGAIARVEIAGKIDVSPATVSVVTGELLQDGLIEAVEPESRAPGSGRGRPKTLLRLRPNAAHAIGIKLALHQVAVSVTDFVGEVLASDTVPIPPESRSPQRVIDICDEQIGRMLRTPGVDRDRVIGVGIGISGCVTYATGVVNWSPMFADRDVPLKAAMEARTGLDIVVDNECNLVGLAEKWFGLGRTYPSYILVTVEHGVGMSIVLNQQLYRGARGFAGEFGHTKIEIAGAACRCGQRGCVEAYVADYAVVREAEALVGAIPIHDQRAVQDALDALAARADSGDLEAAAIFERAGHVLGIALANAVNVFDPPVIIISGQRTVHPARVFIDSLKKSMSDHVLAAEAGVPPIEIHPWGDDLWARGAAALVLEEFMPNDSLRMRPASGGTAAALPAAESA